MLIADKVLSATSLEDARQVIADAFDADDDIRDKYDWSDAAINHTTGQFVAEFLAKYPPSFRYPYNQISENLRVAGSHLEQCLNRQDAIFQLESSCLSAVIDALNSDRVFHIDQTLETYASLADARNAGAVGMPDVGQQLVDKYAIRRSVFDFQQKLFRGKGSALNFNERITFLRKLQADSLRSIYERLETARIGLAMAGISIMRKVPVWDAANPATLLELVLWMREALRGMDLHTTTEYPVTISIDTQRDAEFFQSPVSGFLTSAQIAASLQSGGFDVLLFHFSDEVVKKRTAWPKSKSVRLAYFSIGIVFGSNLKAIIDASANKDERDRLSALASEFRNWRSTLRLGARITPPPQIAQFETGEKIEWQPNGILLDELVPVTESVDAGALASIPTSVCANLNPVGTWRISVNDKMTVAGDELPLSKSPWENVHDWATVKGIVITMTVMLKS